jgi:type IV secretion system protein VirB8
LSLDNPDSPVLRLQRYATRKIEVQSINFTLDDEVVVRFRAISTENNGKILEDTIWEANISFLMDKLNVNALADSPFNFTVSDYKVNLIRDNNAK